MKLIFEKGDLFTGTKLITAKAPHHEYVVGWSQCGLNQMWHVVLTEPGWDGLTQNFFNEEDILEHLNETGYLPASMKHLHRSSS